MSRKKNVPAETPPAVFGAKVEDVVSANYAIKRPYGGGILGTPKRFMLATHEHDAIGTLSEAADEFPALRALADWAAANGAPEGLLEAWESAKHGASWATEGRTMPEGWKPYRGG